MRKIALESPTAGPFLFLRYTDDRKVACKITNPLTNKVSTVSTSNITIGKKVVEESDLFLYE